MVIVWADGGVERELEVVVDDPEATVGDLIRALTGTDDTAALALSVDGRLVASHLALSTDGPVSGQTVAVVTPSAAGSGSAPGAGAPPVLDGGATVEVAVTGGLDAGACVALGPGAHLVGRAPGAAVVLGSPTVSARHAELRVAPDGATTIADLGSRNGTWRGEHPVTGPYRLAADQTLRLGAVEVTIRPILPSPELASVTRRGPTLAFNRPPRPTPPPAPAALTRPRPPRPPEPPAPIGLAGVLAPLVVGGAMVGLTGNPMFALFLLLSPVLAVGQAWDSRRRRRRLERRERSRWQAELRALGDALGQLADREISDRIRDTPDLAELRRRAAVRSPLLWARRPGHHDWLRVRLGNGCDSFSPALDPGPDHDEMRAVIEAGSRVAAAPVICELATDTVLGLAGPREATLAVARSLVIQATTLHGPADLSVAILTRPERAGRWAWARWLPHAAGPGGSGLRAVAPTTDRAERHARALLTAASGAAPAAETPGTTLVVVDDERLIQGRRSPVRRLLRGHGGPVAGVVIAATEEGLPASCATVLRLHDADGQATLRRVRAGSAPIELLATGASELSALITARHLAALDDPEAGDDHGDLPHQVGLMSALGLDDIGPELIAERWSRGGRDPAPVAPLGAGADDIVEIDLVRDGPHALVAGTTGSGKSELLRSLVAGLAVASGPEHLTFLLIDFKGGSAFDRSAALPHTVGLVTDLDPHLAQRALRCLEAELRHRERVLRAAGASDLGSLRTTDAPPLPRLVVVIDEFATLRAELPDFVESLVDVAQRGRSLGVHLVLATQRPSGAVSESIKANTNLRIALRVQDAADSADVIGGPAAAHLSRHRPGRALARIGPGEVVAVQTALSTGPAGAGAGAVTVRPFADDLSPAPPGPDADHGPTELDRIVAACRAAHTASGRPLPRRPWPDPLPSAIALDELAATVEEGPAGPPDDGLIAFGVADDPDHQRRVAAGWAPAEGNLLLAGLPGSGLTTALAALALSAAAQTGPDLLHLHILEMGSGGLDGLDLLPHLGARVSSAERERQARLLAHLRAEVDRRRGQGIGEAPRVLLLVDGVGALWAEWDHGLSPELEGFERIFREGPSVGVHTAVAADRPMALPGPLRSLCRQQLLFRLGDAHDHLAAGFRVSDLPTFVPGRALSTSSGLEVQVAQPAPDLASAARAAAHRHPPPTRPAASIRALPARVPGTAIGRASAPGEQLVHLPVGVGSSALAPVGLTLHLGEHALVAGPARSGRSTALRVIGERALEAGWPVVAAGGPRSPLAALGERGATAIVGADALAAWAKAGGSGHRPTLLLIDDAEHVDLDGDILPELLVRDELRVVAAGRSDALRSLWSHWTRSVRQSRVGLLLQPDVDLDGDLLGVRLPRRSPTALGPGRGHLCADGGAELVQVAQPSDPESEAS